MMTSHLRRLNMPPENNGKRQPRALRLKNRLVSPGTLKGIVWNHSATFQEFRFSEEDITCLSHAVF